MEKDEAPVRFPKPSRTERISLPFKDQVAAKAEHILT